MSAADQILAAVRAAASGTNLEITAHADLRGASVTGTRVQAYVVPIPTGYQVEMWRGRSADPFKVVAFPALSDAAAEAVSAASAR